MSRSANAATADCAKASCPDGRDVRVEFANGERRAYCEFHAEHVLLATSAEVVRHA